MKELVLEKGSDTIQIFDRLFTKKFNAFIFFQ